MQLKCDLSSGIISYRLKQSRGCGGGRKEKKGDDSQKGVDGGGGGDGGLDVDDGEEKEAMIEVCATENGDVVGVAAVPLSSSKRGGDECPTLLCYYYGLSFDRERRGQPRSSTSYMYDRVERQIKSQIHMYIVRMYVV